MSRLITLGYFGAAAQHYHIYRLTGSPVSHEPHYHDYFQVCFVISGEMLHRQGGETVKLGAGDAFIVPPGFVHSLHFGERAEIYSLSFENTLFHPGFPQSNAFQFLTQLQTGAHTLQNGSVRLRVVLGDDQYKSIHALLDCLIRQQKTDCPAGLSAAASLVAAIVYLLSQNYYQDPQNAAALEAAKGNDSILLQCCEYIDTHFRQSLTVQLLAKQFGLSRSSFCTAFTQFTGMPVRKYIAQKRVMEAQMLVRSHPELALSHIALQVGYEDDSTFYRNFLKITGVTPSAYRELCHGNKKA